VLRKVAVIAYGFGAILALLLALAGTNGVIEAVSRGALFDVTAIATTFLPMVALVSTTFFAQRRTQHFALSLVIGVIAAAVSLFFALVNHGFPDRSNPLAVVHLGVVALALCWAVHILMRQDIPSNAKPSNI
jgi:hypothetical protein